MHRFYLGFQASGEVQGNGTDAAGDYVIEGHLNGVHLSLNKRYQAGPGNAMARQNRRRVIKLNFTYVHKPFCMGPPGFYGFFYVEIAFGVCIISKGDLPNAGAKFGLPYIQTVFVRKRARNRFMWLNMLIVVMGVIHIVAAVIPIHSEGSGVWILSGRWATSVALLVVAYTTLSALHRHGGEKHNTVIVGVLCLLAVVATMVVIGLSSVAYDVIVEAENKGYCGVRADAPDDYCSSSTQCVCQFTMNYTAGCSTPHYTEYCIELSGVTNCDIPGVLKDKVTKTKILQYSSI